MWWWFGRWQLIRAMSWQALTVKLVKYGSTASTAVSAYINSSGIVHAVSAEYHGTGTLATVVVAAKGTIFLFFVAALTAYIDYTSAKYSKISSETFRDKHTWKDIYAALDRASKPQACKVEEFDGMAGWTNPALNKRLLLNSGRNATPLKYEANTSPWYAYEAGDLGQKSRGAKLRRYVIEEAMRQKRVIFNSEKIRLCSDIDVTLSKAVRLQRTDYVSSMMTDGVAFQDVYLKADHITISDGWSSFLEQVDGHWRLKPLASCQSSNQLGASTLAFTSDGFLVLIDQTRHNQHSAGKISPSGSGSLDWSEMDGCLGGDFLQLVKNAAARELLEETGLNTQRDFDRDSLIQQRMVILGFTRLVHRGGKPEFFCLARLPKTMDSIRTTTPTFLEGWYSEKSFSHDASAIDPEENLATEIRRICRHYSDTTRIFSDPEKIRRFRLSYQLMHGLALLEECVSDPESLAALQSVLT